LRIYLLRHGIASLRDPRRFPDDSLRPLTTEGRRKLALAAKGMQTAGLEIDGVLTSPLLRARQTARIVAAAIKPPLPVRSLNELSPGTGVRQVIEALAKRQDSGGLLLVGHEPGLSNLASWMLQAAGGRFPLGFKKGGLCRIDCPSPPKPGEGRLVFHLPPRILRRLGRRRS
jgi:phosphohistidine phosphatase